MENEDGQLRAKGNIYSKNSKNDKKFNKKRFGLHLCNVLSSFIL